MKDEKALDISGDGRIDQWEFYRLKDARIATKFKLKVKVAELWETADKQDGSMARLACWSYILKDDEICLIMGGGDAAKGKK